MIIDKAIIGHLTRSNFVARSSAIGRGGKKRVVARNFLDLRDRGHARPLVSRARKREREAMVSTFRSHVVIASDSSPLLSAPDGATMGIHLDLRLTKPA